MRGKEQQKTINVECASWSWHGQNSKRKCDELFGCRKIANIEFDFGVHVCHQSQNTNAATNRRSNVKFNREIFSLSMFLLAFMFLFLSCVRRWTNFHLIDSHISHSIQKYQIELNKMNKFLLSNSFFVVRCNVDTRVTMTSDNISMSEKKKKMNEKNYSIASTRRLRCLWNWKTNEIVCCGNKEKANFRWVS